MIANATSVTLNLLSTSQPAPALPTTAAAHPSRHIPGRIRSNSARKVKAHRSPHHAAGAVLKARHTSSGTYHLRSTPRMTATRGCKADEKLKVDSLRPDAVEVGPEREEAGEGGTMVEGEEGVAWSSSSGRSGERGGEGAKGGGGVAGPEFDWEAITWDREEERGVVGGEGEASQRVEASLVLRHVQPRRVRR